MADRATTEGFFKLINFAIIGVSQNPKKFGNAVFKEMKNKGFKVFPVGKSIESFEGERCYPDIQSLPEKVEGVIISIHPTKTKDAVRQAHEAGIANIWIQQGSASPEALKYCEDNGIKAIHGYCALMFVEPMHSFHKFHRFIWKIIGKYPKESKENF